MFNGIHKKKIIFILLFFSIFLVYSNSFRASWHFDDFNNIHNNAAICISDISPTTLYKTFFANPVNPNSHFPYRPVSNLSFALNWYIGTDNVFGYHVVNFAIHLATALLIYLTVPLIYKTPNTEREVNLNHVGMIAFLSSLLWALSPIQTQAVTYIVQRMASLAGLFYIASIFFYLKGRLEFTKTRFCHYTLTAICVILANGSKENAVTVVFSLILIEFIFFNRISNRFIKNKSTLAAISITLATIALFYILNIHLHFENSYSERPFTINERLLTEPRIILHYICQILFPSPEMFSIDHEINISKSIFIPLTTFISIILNILIICYSIINIEKCKIFSFSILFFYLTHSVESTFIPLELEFEHRNYIPTFFIFIPISSLFIHKIFNDSIPNFQKKLWVVLIILICLFLGISTYKRNNVWSTEETLWEDAFSKNPNSSRSAYNLGHALLNKGEHQKALSLFIKAEQLSQNSPIPKYYKKLALNGIGSVYFLTSQHEKSIPYFEQILSIDPKTKTARRNLALTYIATNDLHKSFNIIDNENKFDFLDVDNLYIKKILEILLSKTPTINDNFFTEEGSPKNLNLINILLSLYNKSHKHNCSMLLIQKFNGLLSLNIYYQLLKYDIYLNTNNNIESTKTFNHIRENFQKDTLLQAINNNTLLNIEIYNKDKMIKIFNKNSNE